MAVGAPASETRGGAIRLRESGMTLVEVLATMVLLGLCLGMSFLYLSPMKAPLRDSVLLTQNFLRGARSTAMATTSACRIRPTTDHQLITETASACDATTWTSNPQLVLHLPDEVSFTDTGWTVCYNGLGMSDSNVTIGLRHVDSGMRHVERHVEVLVGGMTRELP